MPSTPAENILTSHLDSLTNESYRLRVGSLGLLGLLEPTREALQDYEGWLVAQARRQNASWEQIGEALGVPRQTAHRRWSHVG